MDALDDLRDEMEDMKEESDYVNHSNNILD
jgi:hypothetical protein